MQRSYEFDVVVIGSLNLDLVARTTRLPLPGETVTGSTFTQVAGGKGLNQAVAAARAGASVALVGAVGDDHAGATMRQVLLDEGIDDRWLVEIPDTPTGRAMITVDDDAENVIIVIPGANAWEGDDHQVLPTGRVVLGQLEVPQSRIERAFAAARDVGSTTILNPAPATELTDALLANTDLVIPNEHEVTLLGGSDSLRRRGVTTVVVTQGAAGTTIVDDTGERHSPAFSVSPIDTTGAGDAFCGALASQLADGADLASAVRFGMGAGALATTAAGAVPSLPRRAAIDQLIGD